MSDAKVGQYRRSHTEVLMPGDSAWPADAPAGATSCEVFTLTQFYRRCPKCEKTVPLFGERKHWCVDCTTTYVKREENVGDPYAVRRPMHGPGGYMVEVYQPGGRHVATKVVRSDGSSEVHFIVNLPMDELIAVLDVLKENS